MEFSDILIFLLAAIGMIVSAVTKSAKKKTKEYDIPNYDEWSMDEEDESRSEEQILAYEVADPHDAENRYWSYDHESIKKIEASDQINDLHREPTKHMADDNAYKIDDDKTPNCIDTFKEGVNLRDAIIYSELLKPKFKEY